MPELPEVEILKNYIISTSLNKIIEQVKVKNDRILEEIAGEDLQKRLAAKEFLSSQRYGKYLFTNVSGEFWLVMHFGMTGDLKYFKSMKEDPEHDRLLISFENGYHLAFDCQRKFGRVSVTSGIEDFIKKKNLGKDALELDFEIFQALVQKRQGAIKPFLMNQHIVAGIGNIYSDEILFQTHINPKTKINDLDCTKLRDLFNNMKRILKTAIKTKGDSNQFPENYLIKHRFQGADCPGCVGKIVTAKISGRTTYFCESCQKQV